MKRAVSLIVMTTAMFVAGCGSDDGVDPVVGEWVYDKSDAAVSVYLDAMERYAVSEGAVSEGADDDGEVDDRRVRGVSTQDVREALARLGISEFPKTAAERRELFGHNIRISKAVIRYEPDGRAISMTHPDDPSPQVFRWRRKGDVIEVRHPEFGGEAVLITARLEGNRLWVEGFPGVREAWIRRD